MCVMQREATDLLRRAAERCSAKADRLEGDSNARAGAVGDTVSAANAVVRLCAERHHLVWQQTRLDRLDGGCSMSVSAPWYALLVPAVEPPEPQWRSSGAAAIFD